MKWTGAGAGAGQVAVDAEELLGVYLHCIAQLRNNGDSAWLTSCQVYQIKCVGNTGTIDGDIGTNYN